MHIWFAIAGAIHLTTVGSLWISTYKEHTRCHLNAMTLLMVVIYQVDIPAQPIQHLYPMLVLCWPTVCEAGPALNQHWVAFRVCCMIYVSACLEDKHVMPMSAQVWPRSKPILWKSSKYETLAQRWTYNGLSLLSRRCPNVELKLADSGVGQQ